MFAVIKTGGKQYSVAAEDTITVMSLAGEPGDAAAGQLSDERVGHAARTQCL